MMAMMGVIVAAALLWGVGVHKGLVSRRDRFKNAFARIDIQFKCRYDLIPSLVEVARGYVKHERETLEAVILERNLAYQASDSALKDPTASGAISRLQGAEGELRSALRKLMTLQESCPELKANQAMSELVEELASTEGKIASARQGLNDEAMRYNAAIERFPASMVAGMGGFARVELLQATESGEAARRG